MVSKYLPLDQNLLVSLTPKTSVLDIYQTVLSRSGIRISGAVTERRSTEANAAFSTRVKAMIPILGGGEVGASGGVKSGSASEQKFDEVPINLELPRTSR